MKISPIKLVALKIFLYLCKQRKIMNTIMPKHERAKIVWDTDKYKNAMAYLDTLSNNSDKPIPADEDGREARTEKYAL